jgi:hypothetical protein
MSALQLLATLSMTLSPGLVASFYGALGGFYMQKFQTRYFYAHMLLCYCVTQPLVPLMQRYFDSWFDQRFSTRFTFSFRIIGMQIVLGASIVFWMYAPATKLTILAFGVWIGIISAVILSSSFQMVAAMEPDLLIYARLGQHLSGLLVPFVFIVSGFNATSSRSQFQVILLAPICFCALTAFILTLLAATTKVFSKAFERLAYDLTSTIAEQNYLDGEHGFDRQVTETSPLCSSEAKLGVPPWVYLWMVGNSLSMGLELYITSLVGFFGSCDMAQKLTLIRMSMHLVGRTLAIAVPYAPAFTKGPWHTLMAANVLIVMTSSTLCLSRAFGHFLPKVLFLISFSTLPSIRSFTSSLVDVTVASYTEVRDRKSLARLNEMGCFSCVLIGLLLGQVTGSLLTSAREVGHVHALSEIFSAISSPLL